MMNCRLCTEKPNIVTTIKVERLEWAGHVVRIADDRVVKKVFLGKLDFRRKSRKTRIKVAGLFCE